MKILAFPRDPNPFQESLYRRMRSEGAVVCYLDGPTRSHTLNIALAPAVLVVRRLQGYVVLHVHWVFGFVPEWARGSPVGRVFRYWYRLLLGETRLLGFRVVWTAHNVLPHTPIFDDDVSARRTLVARCDHVVAMNHWVAEAVRTRFTPACAVSVIPHGVDVNALRVRAANPPGPRTLTFVGRVERYKGVAELLEAFVDAELPLGTTLVVAGECRDAGYAAEVRAAAAGDSRIRLSLRVQTDEELAALLEAADAVVLPFRTISTSGSLLTAMGSGAPVVVPGLPQFADIPRDALLRYEPGPRCLSRVLERIAHMSAEELQDVSTSARHYLLTVGWDAVARQYVQVFDDVVASGVHA